MLAGLHKMLGTESCLHSNESLLSMTASVQLCDAKKPHVRA